MPRTRTPKPPQAMITFNVSLELYYALEEYVAFADSTKKAVITTALESYLSQKNKLRTDLGDDPSAPADKSYAERRKVAVEKLTEKLLDALGDNLLDPSIDQLVLKD